MSGKLVTALLAFTGVPAGAAETLVLPLPNAGLEEVVPPNDWPAEWRPRAHVGVKNHRTSVDARTGARAAEITFERKETGYYYSAPVSLPPCEQITGEAWIRVQATARGAYLLLYYQDAESKYMGVRQESPAVADTGGQWKKLSVTGPVPAGAAAVVLALQLDGPGTAAFDDARLAGRPPQPIDGVTLDSPTGVPIVLAEGATVVLGDAMAVGEPASVTFGLESRTALPPEVTPVVFWFHDRKQLGMVRRPPVCPLGGLVPVRFVLEPKPGVDRARPGFLFADREAHEAVSVLLSVPETKSPTFVPVPDMDPGSHPRLFAPRDELPVVRARLLDAAPGSHHARLWHTVKTHADESLARKEIVVYGGRYRTTLPPALPPKHEDRFPYWTGLSREIERGMQTMATVYLVSGDETYGRKAVEWALALAEWPYWTDPSYGSAGSCLDTSHFCHGTVIVYDYCHDLLDDPQRAALREALLAKGAAGVMRDATSGWARNFGWPNGFAVVMGGMGIAGAATLGEDPRAAEYVAFARRRLYDFLDARDRDGGYVEGLLYGGYAMTHITPFAEALRVLGDPGLANHPYWEKTMRFAATCLAPATGTHVNFCDASRNSSVYWTTALLRAANDDPVARWHLANSAFGTKVGDWGMTYALTAARLPLTGPAEPPRSASVLYRDIGWTLHRSGFGAEDLLLAVRSGPHGSHCQADQNSWQLCVGGVWLGRDPGYGKPQTQLHNTLLVDGEGQARSGGRVTGFAAVPGLQYSRHEAGDCYASLERFTRHVFMLAGELIVLIDDVVPVDADTLPEIESRIHHDRTDGWELRAEGDARIVLRAPTESLRIVLPSDPAVALSTGETGVSRYAALAWKGRHTVPMVLVPHGPATRTAELRQTRGAAVLVTRDGVVEDRLLLAESAGEHEVGEGVSTDARVAWIRFRDGVPTGAAVLAGTRLDANGRPLIRLEKMGDAGCLRL